MTTDRDLICEAVRLSGLGSGKFATRIMGRNPRTTRQWRDDNAVPENARDWLVTWNALPPRMRAMVVRILAA